jgi:hypothetical protein
MKNAATGRAKGVLNRPVGGGFGAKYKKILNRRNEPKVLLKINRTFRDPREHLALQTRLTVALGGGQEYLLGRRKVDNGNSG